MSSRGNVPNRLMSPWTAGRLFPRSPRCLVAWAALFLAVLTTTVLGSASPASAHTELVGSSPVSGTVAATAPTQVTLTFSERVNLALGRISVMGPDGRTVDDGAPVTLSDAQVSVRLRPRLPHGTYVVSYRVISSDGHPVAGGFPFSIVQPSLVDRVVPTGEAYTAPIRPHVLALLASGKYLGYAGIILLVGALVMVVAFRSRCLPGTAPRRWAWWGVGLLAGGTLVALSAQVPYSTGAGFTDVTWAQAAASATATVTLAQLLRLAVLLAAVPLIRAVLGSRPLRISEQALAALLSVALFLTWPLSGHGGTGSLWWLTLPLGALHVAALSVWIGGLVVLVRSVLPAADPRELATILPLWSRLATWAVIVLTASGIIEAAVRTRSAAALTGTTYGWLLLAKTAGLAAMLLVAASARRAIRRRYASAARAPVAAAGRAPSPSLAPRAGGPPIPQQASSRSSAPVLTASLAVIESPAPEEAGTVRVVRRSALLELALSTLIIGLATALVQTQPVYATRPDRTVAPTAAAGQLGGPFYSIDRMPSVTLQVDLDPAQVGSNTMLMTALTPAGQPLAVHGWSVNASLPSAEVRNVQVPVKEMAAGVAYAFPQLPKPGDWTFIIAVSTSETEQTVVTHIVRVY